MTSPWAGFAGVVAVGLVVLVIALPVARMLGAPRLARWASYLILPLAAIWAALFARLAIAQHDGFRSHAYDLGIYDQVVWNTSQGRWFENSIMHFLPQFLGDHFSLALAALAPLYLIWSDARVLLIVQAIALALTALPIAAYARVKLHSGLAAVGAGTAFLLHPGNAFTALFDFHDIVFAPPLIALALFLLLTNRPRGFVITVLPILIIKEEMGIIVAAIGVWTVIFTRYRRIGAVVAVAGVAYLLLVLFVVIPMFNPDGQYYYLRRYFDAGEPGGGSVVSLGKIGGLIFGLLTPEKVAYLGYLLVPFLLLPFGGTPTLMALPTLGYQLLSPEFPFDFITRHYSVVLLPFLAFGAIDAAARLSRIRRYAPAAATAGMTAAALAAYLWVSPGPLGGSFDPRRFEPNPRSAALREAIALIPADGRVMAQTDLVPHLTQRRVVYMFPDSPTFGDVDFVLLDLAGNKYPLTDPEDDYDRAIQQFILSPDFTTVFDRDNVLLLQRRQPIQPAVSLEAVFARRVAIDGYSLASPTVAAGGDLGIQIWWRSVATTTENYKLFLHVIDSDGVTRAQIDVYPTEDWYPTSMWDRDRRFVVPYTVPIPAELPAGGYRVRLGLVSEASGRRALLADSADSILLPATVIVRR